MHICLMIEGQEDVTWDEWVAIARCCESSGIEGLFRSDHYLSVMGVPERGSLDAWTTLAGLAAITERTKLGTMVSPASFRHPSVLAKSATTVDHISNGRVELGLGAGWHEPEHVAYGFPFHDAATRVDIFSEQLEIVHRTWNDEPVDFAGTHYTLKDLDALPRPVQRPHPNLIVGGHAGRRSVSAAARWADEYNTIFATPQECRRRRRIVDDACASHGREPLVFSLMTGCIVAETEDELHARARAVLDVNGGGGSPEGFIAAVADEWIVGTIDRVLERLAELEEAGVQRVMLQHLVHRDTEMIELIGEQLRG